MTDDGGLSMIIFVDECFNSKWRVGETVLNCPFKKHVRTGPARTFTFIFEVGDA